TQSREKTTTRDKSKPDARGGQSGKIYACNASVLSGKFATYRDANHNRIQHNENVFDGALWVTNISGVPCTLQGYGDIKIVDPSGQMNTDGRPEPIEHGMTPGPTQITLQPGAMAMRYVRWQEALAGKCSMN